MGLTPKERVMQLRARNGLPSIEQVIEMVSEAEAAVRKETQGPRAALEKLLEKLGQVESHPEYKSVWTLAYLHGQPYSGPTWEKEVQDARAVLKEGN